MNSLKTYLNTFEGPISGAFRMRHPVISETSDGRTYLRLFLEDYSGSLPAYAWEHHMFTKLRLQDLSCVFVQGLVRKRIDGPVVDLSQIVPLEVREGEVARLIPWSLCPMPWLLVLLQVMVERLTIPALKNFFTQVLDNDSIAFPFVSAPASLNHHHNSPSGLLSHSLECAQMVARFREFSSKDLEIGMTAALMHDLGKILTLTPAMQRTTLGHAEHHHKLTFEILEPYLQGLQYEWPEGAEQLRYILNWKQRSQIPHYDMADVVTCCDRISTGLDMKKKERAWFCTKAERADPDEAISLNPDHFCWNHAV